MQGHVSKTAAWTNIAGSTHAQEALTFIQESDARPPVTHEETAAALVLTLHSWTRGHTIVLHEKKRAPLCTHRNMPTDHRVRGRIPPGMDTRTRRRRIHPGAHHPPREQGGRKERIHTRTDHNPPNKTSSPTLNPIQATSPCPHRSGAQNPTVHGRRVPGMHATRLDQVRDGDPGGAHGATGYHAPYDMGQRSARWRHWGDGYDRSNPVRRPFEAR